MPSFIFPPLETTAWFSNHSTFWDSKGFLEFAAWRDVPQQHAKFTTISMTSNCRKSQWHQNWRNQTNFQAGSSSTVQKVSTGAVFTNPSSKANLVKEGSIFHKFRCTWPREWVLGKVIIGGRVLVFLLTVRCEREVFVEVFNMPCGPPKLISLVISWWRVKMPYVSI